MSDLSDFKRREHDPLVKRAANYRVRVARLEAALAVYADARNWAIRRNGKTVEDCIWIGPGATDTVPDGPKTAREALT